MDCFQLKKSVYSCSVTSNITNKSIKKSQYIKHENKRQIMQWQIFLIFKQNEVVDANLINSLNQQTWLAIIILLFENFYNTSNYLFTQYYFLISKQMESRKETQDISYSPQIIQGCFFIHNNLLTKLTVHLSFLCFSNQKIQCTYNFNFDFSFDILKVENGWNLIFYCPEPISFFSLIDLESWEQILIKIMKRKRFHEFYKGIQKIGAGNFASVYIAERVIDKKRFAVKAFKKDSTYKAVNGKEGLENEINILKRLNHPNINRLEAVHQTANSLYIVLQLIRGRNLGSILDSQKIIELPQRKKIIKGILSGLAQMQSKRIVHRDIKPENIMITQCGEAKIVDFGLATDIRNQKYLYVRCGTPGFVAPQIISIKDTDQARMSCISDVFSAGAIFYQMIFGFSLFEGKSNNQVLDKNRKCSVQIKGNEKLNLQEMCLLRRMLDIYPETRISASQALKSSYFQDKSEKQKKALFQIQNNPMVTKCLPPLKNLMSKQHKLYCFNNQITKQNSEV